MQINERHTFLKESARSRQKLAFESRDVCNCLEAFLLFLCYIRGFMRIRVGGEDYEFVNCDCHVLILCDNQRW